MWDRQPISANPGRETMKNFAFLILAIALIVSCSGGDKSTGPEYTPSISTAPGVIAFTSAAEAYKLPDPNSEIFTNNTEDTLRCYLTNNSEWLHYDIDTLYLLPHTSQTVSVSVIVKGLPVTMHFDTLFVYNSADSTRMRFVPVRLTIVVNYTSLDLGDPQASYRYLGQSGDIYYFYVECSWNMICSSNGGNPVHVFQYFASIQGDGVFKDVSVDVFPAASSQQQTRGAIDFILYGPQGPELNVSWGVSVAYRSFDHEYHTGISFSI
jgi:hypothetical protein